MKTQVWTMQGAGMDVDNFAGQLSFRLAVKVSGQTTITGEKTFALVEKQAYDKAVEALKQINNEWCQHPHIRLATNEQLDRDWCGSCGSWVHRNTTNPAYECLIELGELSGQTNETGDGKKSERTR